MFSLEQLEKMNNNNKFSSRPWIKNLDNINKFNNNKLYKLYATNNAFISSGREYIAIPIDIILSEKDYLKYNILK